MSKPTTTQTNSDWLSVARFARFPLEVLSLDLTKNQLQVFLVILSYAGRNGYCGSHSPSQETIAEILGWYLHKVTPNDGLVNSKCAELKELGLLSWTTKNGVDPRNIYTIHLPESAKLRPTTDRTTAEYLAGAEQRRQAKKEAYKEKNKKKLENIATVMDINFPISDTVEGFDSLSDSDFNMAIDFMNESIGNQNLNSEISNTVRESDEAKVHRLINEIQDEYLRDMIQLSITKDYRDFSTYPGYDQLRIFKKIHTTESIKIKAKRIKELGHA
jgi:hypothetical protein